MTLLKSRNSLKILSLFFLLGQSGWAVPIAIIDSGTDVNHKDLMNHTWTNPKPGGGEGYVDDIHGWNFAENNNQIIDYSYLGKFSPDTTKYFDIQLKVLNGTASDEEKKWIEEKRKDQSFIQELMKFGNFVHGTHVAGISSKDAPAALIMAAKIIPTEVRMPGHVLESILPISNQLFWSIEDFMEDIKMNFVLDMLATQQSELLTKVGKYVGMTGMKAANCSFGTSMVQTRVIVKLLAQNLLKRELTETEIEKYAQFLMSQIIEKGANFVGSAKETFFAFAAGNDGSDNDHEPVFPANLKAENTITVAASKGFDRLASFSNFGATKVEIAAPGVGIRSSMPGTNGEQLVLSGTSQAAPFITRLIGEILDTNPKLTFAEVKRIMMETVDKKAFLIGKVVSGGIANEQRALQAAKLSLKTTLEDAIRQAIVDVTDRRTENLLLSRWGLLRTNSIEGDSEDGSEEAIDGEPIPLPPLFQ